MIHRRVFCFFVRKRQYQREQVIAGLEGEKTNVMTEKWSVPIGTVCLHLAGRQMAFTCCTLATQPNPVNHAQQLPTSPLQETGSERALLGVAGFVGFEWDTLLLTEIF